MGKKKENKKSELKLTKKDLKLIKQHNIKKHSREKGSVVPLTADQAELCPTHYFITSRAFQFATRQGTGERNIKGNILCEKAVYPDNTWDAASGLFADHFYDQGENYLEKFFKDEDKNTNKGVIQRFLDWIKYIFGKLTGNNADISNTHNAVTCFVKYYSRAVDNKSCSDDLFTENLGYALHYIQDLCAPHHAYNAPAVATNHAEFEKWVNTAVNDRNSYKKFDINSEADFVERNFPFSISELGVYGYLIKIHTLASANSKKVIEAKCNEDSPLDSSCVWYEPARYNILLAQKASADVISYCLNIGEYAPAKTFCSA
jgi:hypothetical protein